MSLLESITPRLTACHLREYTPEDLPACLAIYHSNESEFHPAGHVASFTSFLERGTSYMLVLEHEGLIVGCGGLELRGETPTAALVYGLIHRDHHHRGFGTTLLAARLSLLEPEGQPVHVVLTASPTVASFFAQFGFELQRVAPDFYGPGLHGGHLTLPVAPGDVEVLRSILSVHGVTIALNELSQDALEESEWSP